MVDFTAMVPAIITAKKQFPLFSAHPDVAYLDSAATTQTPENVLAAMDSYYRTYRANIERGIYDLSAQATQRYEAARTTIARFLNAASSEIVFTNGTTQGLNMLCAGLAPRLTKGKTVVLTRYEHHANLIPWQEASKRYGFTLRFIELTPDHGLDLVSAETAIDQTTAIVSVASVANSIGTTTPLEKIIALARRHGALVIVDAAQSIAHAPTDTKKLDCDFMVFSGHKMYGPTGIGILYGKKDSLEKLQPTFYGGGMIQDVTYQSATWRELPHRLEPGTPNIAGAIGLGAAVEFIQTIGWDALQAHEQDIVRYFFENKPAFVSIHGPGYSTARSGVISFSVSGIHPHDLAEILNERGIAIRAGHHCAMPLMTSLGLSGTARASFAVYSSTSDIDRLFEALTSARSLFKK